MTKPVFATCEIDHISKAYRNRGSNSLKALSFLLPSVVVSVMVEESNMVLDHGIGNGMQTFS